MPSCSVGSMDSSFHFTHIHDALAMQLNKIIVYIYIINPVHSHLQRVVKVWWKYGNSLVVQWLALHTSLQGAPVPSLVRELISFKLPARLPWWLGGKESTCQCRRLKYGLWIRKTPWRRAWHPLQYSCLENPMDRGAWWATVLGVVRESDPTVTKQQQQATQHGPPNKTHQLFASNFVKFLVLICVHW